MRLDQKVFATANRAALSIEPSWPGPNLAVTVANYGKSPATVEIEWVAFKLGRQAGATFLPAEERVLPPGREATLTRPPLAPHINPEIVVRVRGRDEFGEIPELAKRWVWYSTGRAWQPRPAEPLPPSANLV